MLAYLDLGIVVFVLLGGFGLGAMFGWSLSLRTRAPGGDGGGARLYDLNHYAEQKRGRALTEAPPNGEELSQVEPLRRRATRR